MLRSTFAAYNAAHPDKPLINPRGAAAGTVRAKDPKTVAERRLRFFAFDLDAADGAHTDLEAALQDLGFDAADMGHCDDANAAQKVIAAIEAGRDELDYDLDGAVMRLADRNAYAAAGTRANSPARRAGVQVRRRGEDDGAGRRALGRRQDRQGRAGRALEPVFVGGTTVTRATLANQEVIRARGIRIGDTVLVRRAGDVIPFVAGVLDASKRTGAEREIVPPSECPSCGEPLTEQGNSRELFCTNVACPAQTVRRLIHWASRAAADIEAVGPVWIERLAEAGAREPVRLLRPHEGAAARVRAHRRGLGGPDDRLDRGQQGRRAAARADRAVDPDGVRGHGRAAVPPGFASLEAVADAGAETLVAGRGHRPEGRGQPDRAPDAAAAGAGAAARARRHLDVREEDLPPQVAADAPLAGKTVVITGTISDPRSGEKIPRPTFQRLCEKAGATTASSVSANTDLLICGADVGASKTAKAEKLGVEIVDQAAIWEQLIAAGRRPDAPGE